MRTKLALLTVLLLLGSLVSLNILASRHFIRSDFTELGEYTLSPGFEKILAGIEDRVVVKAYISSDLPFYFTDLKRRLVDFLEEVKIRSGGKVSYRILDTTNDKAARADALQAGVPEVDVNVFEEGKQQRIKVHFGLAFYYRDRTEKIPVVEKTENLEYEFGTLLLRLTRDEKPAVSIMAGSDPQEIRYDSLKILREELGKTYNVSYTSPISSIAPEIKTLIVIRAKAIDEATLFRIEQFLFKGGTVIFCLSGMNGPPQNVYAQAASGQIFELLDHFGVKVEKNLVADRSNARISIPTGFFNIAIEYPFFVRVISRLNGKPWGFNREIPALAEIGSVVLPWVSSLDVEDTRPGFETLLYSTPYSILREGFVSVHYNQKFPNLTTESDTRILAVSYAGQLTSFFEGRDTVPSVSPSAWEKRMKKVNNARFVVIGTDNLLDDNAIRLNEENIVFINNLVDQYTLGEELISIRSKHRKDRTFETLTVEKKRLIKYANLAGIPIFVLLAGIVRYVLRRRRVRGGMEGLR